MMLKSFILTTGRIFSSKDTNFLFELRETKEGRTNDELQENKERRRDNEKFKHKQEKPSGFETLCHQDPSCPVSCNVCCMLPYHTKTGFEEKGVKGFYNLEVP